MCYNEVVLKELIVNEVLKNFKKLLTIYGIDVIMYLMQVFIHFGIESVGIESVSIATECLYCPSDMDNTSLNYRQPNLKRQGYHSYRGDSVVRMGVLYNIYQYSGDLYKFDSCNTEGGHTYALKLLRIRLKSQMHNGKVGSVHRYENVVL